MHATLDLLAQAFQEEFRRITMSRLRLRMSFSLLAERGDTCFRYVTAEKYLEGKYMKMSNNAGSVNSGDHHVIKRMELSDGPTHIVVRRVVFL